MPSRNNRTRRENADEIRANRRQRYLAMRARNAHNNENDEITALNNRGIQLIDTGNPVGEPASQLAHIQKTWGAYYTALQKNFKQKFLNILISCFSDYYFALLNENEETINDFFFIASLLKWQNSGESFQYGGWGTIEEQLRNSLDISVFPKLFISVTDRILKGNQTCVIRLNPIFSDAFFRDRISSISKNVQGLDRYIVKQLELLLIPNLAMEDVIRIQDTNTESKYHVFILFLTESLKNCFKTIYMCSSCVLSLKDHDSCIGHIATCHKNYIDLEQYVSQKELRQQLELEEQRQRMETEKNEMEARMQARITQLENELRLLQ